MKKEFDNSHRCEQMRNQAVTGVIIQIDGRWYQIQNTNTQIILYCPFCGFNPSEKDCYPYGKEPK
jgi:hypothetical protein